ncbi:MAG: ATP-binding protein [Pseudomonadales bacterium]
MANSNVHPWYSLTAYAREKPLSYRMMRYIFCCSVLFIILSTAVQVRLAHQREMAVLAQRLTQIGESYVVSLTQSMWDVDQAQIDLQLKGISALPDIAAVQLRDYTLQKTTQIASERAVTAQDLYRDYPLIKPLPDGRTRDIGKLTVVVDLPALQQRLWQSGVRSLFNQSLLMLLIMAAIAVILQRQITRHLEAMAKFSREIGRGKLSEPLTLSRRQPLQVDELDQLQLALNEMRQSIKADQAARDQTEQALRYNRDQLQQMVDSRTQRLRDAKEAAEQANSAKSQFLATMSHEVRTPMNGMLGMIQLLNKSALGDTQRRQVEVLQEATQALLGTFNSVLHYAQLEQGVHQDSDVAFSLSALLESVVDLMQYSAREKGLAIVLHHDDMPLYCDKAASIRQIVTNLIANAIKFSSRGTIQVDVLRQVLEGESERIVIDVRDHGIGIAPQQQAHIFERFVQADDSITRRFGGTGLGLSISRQLAESIGGELSVASEPGRGSTFTLRLPLKRASHRQLPEVAVPPVLNALSILLVEDEPINRQVMQALLSAHQVSIAVDARSALEHTRRARFDIILLDMHLPGMSGLTLWQQIKDMPEGYNGMTPVIAVTASVAAADRARYDQAGIGAVVAKPVVEYDLLSKIAALAAPCEHIAENLVEDIAEDIVEDIAEQIVEHEFEYIVERDVPAPELAVLDHQQLAQHIQALGSEKVRGLMRSFCHASAADWQELQEAITGGQPSQIEHLSHKLAGACEALCFVAAAQLLRQLERSATLGDFTCSAALNAVMAQTFARALQQAEAS